MSTGAADGSRPVSPSQSWIEICESNDEVTNAHRTVADLLKEWNSLDALVNEIAEDRSLSLVERFVRIQPLFEQVMWIQESLIEMGRSRSR